MKTILFHVNSLLTGGIEKILIEILKGMDTSRYRIILSIGYDMGSHELLKNQIPSTVEVVYLLKHPLLVTPHKNKKTGKTNFFEKALAELFLPPIMKLVKRKKLKSILTAVDVVIDFDTTLAAMHPLFANKKLIAYCHFGFDNIWKGNKRKLDKLAFRLSQYDSVVMLCDEMKQDASALYPILEKKLVRIYNALDAQSIQKQAQQNIQLPQELLQNGYIISVGRLHEAQKDFTTLLKAYAIAVKRFAIKERLVIVGQGGDSQKLKELTIELGIEHKVLFTGFDSNPYKWMQHAKLFLFSSKYEGLPTVLIEAHILGLPIVATATPTGVKEILMQGDAGTIVPIGDEKTMAESLAEVLQNKPLQVEYVRQAQDLVPQFDINYMIPQLEKLF